MRLQRGARIEPGADASGQRAPSLERGGMVERAVAAEELGAVAVQAVWRPAEVGEGDALAELGVPGVAREQRAGLGVDLGDDVRRGRVARELPSTHST